MPAGWCQCISQIPEQRQILLAALQNKNSIPARPVTDEILPRELKIYKNTLLEGKNEEIRIDAATELLFSEAPAARKILIDALIQSENNTARVAVCKALTLTRAAQEPENTEDFIQPLLAILSTEQDPATAKLAAEATLIFEYEQLSEPLGKIVTDVSQPATARLNATEALKRPDIGAISKLMDLLEDPEQQVVMAAEKALESLGIPVGRDAQARKQIIEGLQRKGLDEFLRDWLIRQERDMARLETERDFWQKQYLAAQDRIYDGINDDAKKGEFLVEHLAGSQAVVRLWALEKVYQVLLGTRPKSKLPSEIGPILVGLVSDQNRDIKLKTAKLLSLMGELNSAKNLLEQLKIEPDDEVRTELFVALGWACYYAFLPDSGIEIAPEIRKQTLEEAAKYLVEADGQKAQKGAEVIRKLLEQDGLTPEEIGRYLGLLHQRYSQDGTDESLRGELLNTMARLCDQSVYKDEAKKVFKPFFEQALNDETDLVREAAVDGLIYIDPKAAIKTLRKDFVNDSSIGVRTKIIELAGTVGDKEDLDWLAEKLALSAESEGAWQTMLKIFRRSDAAVLNEWTGKFESQSLKNGISDEQMAFFLEIAEQKAVGENKPEMVKAVRDKLAQLYTQLGSYEQAAKYWGLMRESAETAEEKEAISVNLLEIYLKWPNVEAAAQLVENSLLEKDLEPNNVIVKSIDVHLLEPAAGFDPNEILAVLGQIQTPEGRPKWIEQFRKWQKHFRGEPEFVPEPNQAGG
jgi:HEAT repeat protein